MDGQLIMHNGLRVGELSYSGEGNRSLIVTNRGVHEPQEERVHKSKRIHRMEHHPLHRAGLFCFDHVVVAGSWGLILRLTCTWVIGTWPARIIG